MLALCGACTQAPLVIQPLTAESLRQQLNACRTLALCVPPQEAEQILRRQTPNDRAHSLAYQGVATPISPHGHFMTALHVVCAKAGNELVLAYLSPKGLRMGKAQLLWSDSKHDLALVRVPFETPWYYRWSPRDHDLLEGTEVLHGGLATGPKGDRGQLSQRVSGTRASTFEHTLQLAPGDSGGPVLLESGELVGVNSAVGYYAALDTRFFSGSASSRPAVSMIERLISTDLARHPPAVTASPR